jgi:Flp pilus assembly pilin Flp
MKHVKSALSRILRDERGGEVIEYALVAGMITVAAIATVTQVGVKVLARWNSVNSKM